uniref:Protein kinase domain-containing protein n=1 Tax=Rhabditophanes sp. KR3021 TaxID=114890 RepID=A0AC35TV97_9BILA
MKMFITKNQKRQLDLTRDGPIIPPLIFNDRLKRFNGSSYIENIRTNDLLHQFKSDDDLNQVAEYLATSQYKSKNADGFETYFNVAYTTNKIIANGAFGQVSACVRKSDGIKCAVKKQIITKFGDFQNNVREFQMLGKVQSHQNIVKLHEAWIQSGKSYLIMECCVGSLYDLAKTHNDLTLDEIKMYSRDMLASIAHIHGLGVLHLDVKLENFFVDQFNVAKLGDFGHAIEVSSINTNSDIPEGDKRYMADELFREQPTFGADIFAAGLCILELATDIFMPENDVSFHMLRKGSFPEELKQGVDESIIDLINAMICVEKSERLSAQHLLKQLGEVKRVSTRIVCEKEEKVVGMVGTTPMLIKPPSKRRFGCINNDRFNFSSELEDTSGTRDSDESVTSYEGEESPRIRSKKSRLNKHKLSLASLFVTVPKEEEEMAALKSEVETGRVISLPKENVNPADVEETPVRGHNVRVSRIRSFGRVRRDLFSTCENDE